MAKIDIQDDNHPHNGGPYLTGDMVSHSLEEWDSPGWIVCDDEEDGGVTIVNSHDDMLEVEHDDLTLMERY